MSGARKRDESLDSDEREVRTLSEVEFELGALVDTAGEETHDH